MKTTSVFAKTLKAFVDDDIQYILSYGGSSSSKTISILQLLLLYALKNENKFITIVAKTDKKARDGAMKDFKRIVLIDDFSYLKNQTHHNQQYKEFRLDNGSVIQFIGADKDDQVVGNRSDVIYFDELNFIKKSVFNQLSARCNGKVLASWNPSSIFYINDYFGDNDVALIHSTYKDNEFVDDGIIKKLLKSAKNNPNFKRVYIDGMPGILKGQIFVEGSENNWEIVSSPPEKKIIQVVYGVDYGYIDPTAVVKISLFEDDSMYIEEVLYEVELTPEKITKRFNNLLIDKNIEIVSEYAGMGKSMNQSLYQSGFNIFDVKKTSIEDGINKMYDFHMYIDIKSENIIYELRNYKWMVDKDDNVLEKPEDKYNHSIDAIRYAQTKLRDRSYVQVYRKRR